MVRSVRSLAFALGLVVSLGFPLVSASTVHGTDDHADPGVSASFALFPTPEEVVDALEKHRGHPWVTLHDLGASKEGRPLRLAEISDPQSPVNRSERAVTFIFTQQHGNEPAGTPAALDLLDAIVRGDEIAKTLENQILLLLPMANPDGAAAETRENAMNTDINRDHIALETPEARLLHEVLNAWDVHVAMDHHEYGGTGLGNPSPLRVYDYDLTTLFPNHGNVRAPTSGWSQKLMYDGVWPRAEAEGYTANEYGEQTVAGIPVEYVAGGPDPGIMRNHIGLHHVSGLLVETRVDAHPNPFHDAARRTALHRVVMDATLEYVHEHAAHFREAKSASRAAALATPATEYLEGDLRGALATAYRIPDSVDEVFQIHGLPLGIVTPDGRVYNLNHELQGHGAAALHPTSSRRLSDGAVAVDPIAVPDAVPGVPLDASDVPAPGAVFLLGLVAVAAFAMRRLR